MLLASEVQEEGSLMLRDLPSRRGGRPKMKRGVCHLQCSDNRDGTWTDRLVEGVASWPHVERGISITGDLPAVSFCVTENARASNPGAFISPQEFARCLRAGPTIYLAMRLVDAHWAIVRGWAEPHQLARTGVIPAGIMVVYTPRDRGELEVCATLFEAAYRFACIDPLGEAPAGLPPGQNGWGWSCGGEKKAAPLANRRRP
ncbi:MAG: hypothetical protein JO015_07210 [Verrucomicrobia bacterium]|nr:hypothetical protein [Verrucomicrobiota bacterium]